MSEIVIFGTNDLAELADYYFEHDSEHEVSAFCVNQEYLIDATFRGKPVLALEELQEKFPPCRAKLFIPMTHAKMNKVRARIYSECKAMGYDFASYVSSKATIFHNEIGENCFILEDNTIQPFVTIGNNVVLWSGNHIGHHSRIEDHVFLSSHVVVSGRCLIEPYSFFGVNSTIRDGSLIREGSLIAMGATLVSQETDSWGVYIGNPARKLRDRVSYEIT